MPRPEHCSRLRCLTLRNPKHTQRLSRALLSGIVVSRIALEVSAIVDSVLHVALPISYSDCFEYSIRVSTDFGYGIYSIELVWKRIWNVRLLFFPFSCRARHISSLSALPLEAGFVQLLRRSDDTFVSKLFLAWVCARRLIATTRTSSRVHESQYGCFALRGPTWEISEATRCWTSAASEQAEEPYVRIFRLSLAAPDIQDGNNKSSVATYRTNRKTDQ
jgi:hypothetical protein